jgi:hypothetical protein
MGATWYVSTIPYCHCEPFLNEECTQQESPKGSDAPTHLRNLLKLDTMGIAAQTLDILYDPERNELLLRQSGDVAQATLDHLKWVLVLML